MPSAWQVPDVDEHRVAALATELALRPLTARIMVARGMHDPDTAARFLAPRLGDLRKPDGVADLGATIERLVTALDRSELIGVFGDYDVDGVTTAAILTSTLRALGARVVTRVASRFSGYGLGTADVEHFAVEGCSVLVAGDCGTSDIEALRLCRERGIDAIVIDHHCVPSGSTPAFALINPHRADDRFPFKGLASCGIAFYLAAALRTRLRAAGTSAGEFDPRDLLDLVALGSIADMVPLVDANRILTSAGLRVLSQRRRPGLRALCRVADVPEGGVTTEQVAFRLGPRLNAAGRLGAAQLALDVLLAADDQSAARAADALDEQNKQRQRIQEQVWAEAERAAAEQEGRPAIVVGGDGWHPGVIGIIAAKIVDRWRRPAVVIGFEADGQGKGSARTVPGFDLFQALQACSGHLIRFGGHAAAAGLSVARDQLEAFRGSFAAEAEARLQGGGSDAIRIDTFASLAELDLRAAEDIERLGPFGTGNPEPVLGLRGVTTASTRRVGARHLQLTLTDGDRSGDAIAFGMADGDPGSGARLDVVISAQVDTFRGNRRARLRVLRWAPAGEWS